MAININIKTKDLDLDSKLNDFINKKVGTLGRLFKLEKDEDVLIEVEVGQSTKHHKNGDIFRAEINLSHKGKRLRTTSKERTIRIALNESCAEMSSRIKATKNKKADLKKKGGAKIKKMIKD